MVSLDQEPRDCGSRTVVSARKAKAVLGKIGATRNCEIMGDRYADVAKALDGFSSFDLAVSVGDGAATGHKTKWFESR